MNRDEHERLVREIADEKTWQTPEEEALSRVHRQVEENLAKLESEEVSRRFAELDEALALHHPPRRPEGHKDAVFIGGRWIRLNDKTGCLEEV